MTGWDVYLDGKCIDKVFFNDNLDEDYVKDSLINHDGYDSTITLERV